MPFGRQWQITSKSRTDEERSSRLLFFALWQGETPYLAEIGIFEGFSLPFGGADDILLVAIRAQRFG